MRPLHSRAAMRNSAAMERVESVQQREPCDRNRRLQSPPGTFQPSRRLRCRRAAPGWIALRLPLRLRRPCCSRRLALQLLLLALRRRARVEHVPDRQRQPRRTRDLQPFDPVALRQRAPVRDARLAQLIDPTCGTQRRRPSAATDTARGARRRCPGPCPGSQFPRFDLNSLNCIT